MRSAPAAASHADGQLHVAAVNAAGEVLTTATDCPGCWTPRAVIGTGFTASPGTAPQMLRAGDLLHLVVRGADNNLHVARKRRADAWSGWTRLTTGGEVQGRVSAVLTESASGQVELHAVFPNGTGIAHRIFRADGQVGATAWPEAEAGIIGSDGVGRAMIVLRTKTGRLLAVTAARAWAAGWATVLDDGPEGEEGAFIDLGSVVHFEGAFHISYTERARIGEFGRDYRDVVTMVVPELGRYNSISDAFAPGRPAPVSAMAVYRNRLVSAHTDDTGVVRYSYLDSAAAQPAWVGMNGPRYPAGDIDDARFGPIDPAVFAGQRPVLVAHADPTAAAGANSYGDDLFAAITERKTGRLRFINFSRAIFEKELGYSFVLYAGQGMAGVPQTHPQAPVLIPDAGADGRPIVTELGYVGWLLPHDFFGAPLRDTAERTCTVGHGSGRFDPPCAAARYPIIVRPAGGSFIGGGTWINQAERAAGNALHEILHALLTHFWGLQDDPAGGTSNAPGADFTARTGLTLAELVEAHTVFGAGVDLACLNNTPGDTCPDTALGRQTGFPDDAAANNYHLSTRQHAFIGAVTAYIQEGNDLRQWVQADVSAGDDILERKYDWISEHIFGGAEFTENAARR